MTQLVVPVMAKLFRQYATDRRVFTRANNFLCSVKPTRCQRRLQGKCLPSDTHLQQRGLPRIKHSICKSLCLPGHTVHRSSQLSCIPPQRAGEHFPLCPRSSAAGPRDRADRLPVGLPVSAFACLQGQSRQGRSSLSHLGPSQAACGASAGHWTQCLHHQRSGVPLYSLIQDY